MLWIFRFFTHSAVLTLDHHEKCFTAAVGAYSITRGLITAAALLLCSSPLAEAVLTALGQFSVVRICAGT